ncbi:MAG: DUF86 domain-containing protein [Thermoplasmata archaeon]|nr:DUF86 domain-containing protein [Thermoplasmata archaeon]
MRPTPETPVANRTYVALGVEHLEAAIRYGRLGKRAFYSEHDPIVFVAVESELRKAFESLNKLGKSVRGANPTLPFDRIAETRQIFTHDYASVDRDDVWRLVTQEAPDLLRRLAKVKIPKSDGAAPPTG